MDDMTCSCGEEVCSESGNTQCYSCWIDTKQTEAEWDDAQDDLY